MDTRHWLTLGVACTLFGSAQASQRTVAEQRPADARGSVEISGVSGGLTLQGWDKPSVDVSGTVGDDVDRVELSGDPAHVSVQIIHKHSVHLWGSDSGPRLTIRVPSGSSVTSNVVSADLRVSDLNGDLNLHTVSGEVTGSVGGNLRVTTVSGDVHMSAPQAKVIAVKTVSGSVNFDGGAGESEVSTVSGDARIKLGAQSRAHLKTVSGDFVATLGLTGDTQLDAETVSGGMDVRLTGGTAAEYDLSTHSGEIENCFGPKPQEPAHGPGARLQFKDGSSNAHVHIVTNSGDVKLCHD